MDSGIGQYTYHLARQLPAVAPDLDFEVLLPRCPDPLVNTLAEMPALRTTWLRGAPRNPLTAAWVAGRLATQGPLLYHAPDWFGLPGIRGRWRTVLTIHDLIPLLSPAWVPRSLKARHPRLYHAALQAIVRGADAVLTDAVASVEAISSCLGVPQERVHVVPLGVAPPLPVPSCALRAVRKRFRLGQAPFVLTVGRPEPYKGLTTLVRAFARARRSELLVIAGAIDTRYPEAQNEARRLGVSNEIIATGAVDPDALEALFQGAEAFVTLSRLEGFGLPPLEAMARGLPVLATSIPVFREILGGAALLVDPDDQAAATRALRLILDNTELRSQLSKEGRKRAAAYAWQTCARRTAKVYRQVLEGRSFPAAPKGRTK